MQFELIEEQEEIDIQSIDELEEFDFTRFIGMEASERFEKTMDEYSKINSILKWAKQIDKKIKEM